MRYYQIKEARMGNKDLMPILSNIDYTIGMEFEIVVDNKNINFDEIIRILNNEGIHKINNAEHYHAINKNSDEWYVEIDISIKPYGFELISPVFNSVDEALSNMKKVFDIIDKYWSTNNSTALHINIGTFNYKDIDLLKLLLFTGQDYVLKTFDRSDNSYTVNNLKNLLSDIDPGEDRYVIYQKINDTVLSNDKYQFFNFKHLKNQKYIEIRGIGGSDYHKKYGIISKMLLMFIRSIQIAMNPGLYKKEYLKKIIKLVDSEPVGVDVNTKIDRLAKRLSKIYNKKIELGKENIIIDIKNAITDTSLLDSDIKILMRDIFKDLNIKGDSHYVFV